MGRKNDLPLGSDRGGRTSAVPMSPVQSGRGLGDASCSYLHDVLNRVSTYPAIGCDDLSRIARGLPAGEKKRV